MIWAVAGDEEFEGKMIIQTPGAGLGLVFINSAMGWRLIEL